MILDRARILVREAGHHLTDRVRRGLASERERRVIDWVGAGNDRTLRLEYELGPDAIVVDVGGWEGQWTSDVFARFCCTVHVFEPEADAAARIGRRFAANPHVHVHRVGLGGSTREEALVVKGPGSSIFSDGSSALERDAHTQQILIRAAGCLFEELGIGRIDLLKVNIEGGEYELLEHLLDAGWMPRVRHLQVQFHDFVPGAEARMHAVQRRIAKTHDLTWQSLFVWEGWTRRAGT